MELIHQPHGDASLGALFVATAESYGSERVRLWASRDSETWEPVSAPPGSHTPNGGGIVAAGAAGDVLYLLVGEDDGSRVLWLGRLQA